MKLFVVHDLSGNIRSFCKVHQSSHGFQARLSPPEGHMVSEVDVPVEEHEIDKHLHKLKTESLVEFEAQKARIVKRHGVL